MASNKFNTSLEQHKRNKALYNMRWGWPRKGAADPDWLNEWINRNGPYLYHGVKNAATEEAIRRDGLYPHDVPKPGQEGRNWDTDDDPLIPGEIREYGENFTPSRSEWAGGFLQPRANHVYMGTGAKAAGYVQPGGGMLAIDLRKLDPTKMNADEDSFLPTPHHQGLAANDPDHPLNKVWEYDHPPSHQEWYPEEGQTLGDWADSINLGNDSEETHHSLANHGSIAYNGVVPPEAIRPGSEAVWGSARFADQPMPYNWQPEMAKVAAAGDELHVGLDIPRNAAKRIHEWVKAQQWPEGTNLEPPDKYHITMMYAPEGHAQHKDGWWLDHLPHAKVTTSGVESFPSNEGKGNAHVLRVESPELSAHAEKLMSQAEWAGLSPSRFDGGYKPHITVAYGPTEAPKGLQPPSYEFDVGPSEVSPPRHQEEEQDTSWDETKTAAIPTGFQDMYHVSPRANRDSILQNGLQGQDATHRVHSPWEYTYGQPHGNYLFDNPEDAKDYIYGIHKGDLEAEPDWEERMEQEELPADFHSWDDDRQDDWYDNAEYKEKTDDPNGYDIYRVRAHGTPLAPDPETRIINQERDNEHLNLGDVWDQYQEHGANEPDMEGVHNQVGGWSGSGPKRYWAPQSIHPSRVQLHEHVPAWNLSGEDHFDRLDNQGEREYPSVWDQLPWTEQPMPGHEAKRSAYTPGEVEGLDRLSLASVAHNIHYRFEQGDLDPAAATNYAHQLLQLIGYPTDEITTQAALQAWQQTYPQDRLLEAGEGSPVQKNLPHAQANYVKQKHIAEIAEAPNPWGEESLWDKTPRPEDLWEPESSRYPSTQAAVAHTGSIPGDEQHMGPLDGWEYNHVSGVNPSYVARSAIDPNQRYFVKPEGDFHNDDLAAERSAFAVAHAMGIPMPHTVVRHVDLPQSAWDDAVVNRRMPMPENPAVGRQIAQVQQGVPGDCRAASNEYAGSEQLMNDYPQDTRNIALLDHVIGNSDRHNGNIVINGKNAFPIDHGGAFSSDVYPMGPAAKHHRTPLTDEEIAKLQAAQQVDVRKSGIRDDHYVGMQERIANMLQNGTMDHEVPGQYDMPSVKQISKSNSWLPSSDPQGLLDPDSNKPSPWDWKNNPDPEIQRLYQQGREKAGLS